MNKNKNESKASKYLSKGINHILEFGKWRYDIALDEFSKAIELDPGLSEAYFYRSYINGLVYKKYHVAIIDINKAIKLQPDNMGYYSYRAGYYFGSHQYNRAIEDIETTNTIPKNPDEMADDFWMLGECYIGLEEYEKAITMFNKSLQIDEFLANSYSSRGYAYLKMNRLEASFTDFNKSLELESKNFRAYYYRTDYWLAIGNKTKALNDLNTALSFAYNDEMKKNVETKLREIEN